MQTKFCTKCGETKEISYFSKDRSTKDGFQTSCKCCKKAFNAAWNAANPEKRKQRKAVWNAANPDKVKAQKDRWIAANPEKVKAQHASYYEANKTHVIARKNAWRAANPDKKRLHRQNRRSMKLAAGGRLSSGLAIRLYKLQRGKCACCGLPLGDDCHLDHIMPLALGGTNTDDNIQLLRAKCNMQKSAKHPVDFMQQRGFLL